MDVAFRIKRGAELLELPMNLKVMGKPITLVAHSGTVITTELPEGVIPQQVINILDLTLGVSLKQLDELPGRFKAEAAGVSSEMERLLVEQDKELEQLRLIPEPQVEINVDDPPLEHMVPTGKLIWDSIFVKLPPIINVQQWLTTADSNDYVYLPNDASKPPSDMEECISNAFYTEVMVNAYKTLCDSVNINPSVRLTNGQVLSIRQLKPMDGSQHTVPGERSSRLANSTLVDFDDSQYSKDFLQCICDLESWQYEKEPIRRRVLAKAEHILMGRTSHTYNQRFIHAIYKEFVINAIDVPWTAHRVPMANCVMGILTQMVVEGLVLSDCKDSFLKRLRVMGFGDYEAAVDAVFERCRDTQ